MGVALVLDVPGNGILVAPRSQLNHIAVKCVSYLYFDKGLSSKGWQSIRILIRAKGLWVYVPAS